MSASDFMLGGLGDVERWRLPERGEPPPVVTRWLDPPPEAFVPAHDPRFLQLGWGRTPEGAWAPVGVRSGAAPFGAWISGPLACGKSAYLLRLLRQFLDAGAGFLALDGAGNALLQRTLPLIPHKREDAVVIFDPQGMLVNGELLIPTLNVLAPALGRCLGVSPEVQAHILLGFIAALDPSVEYNPEIADLASMALRALLLGEQRATLWHLARFLEHRAYRTRVCRTVRDAAVRDFWLERWPDGSAAELGLLSGLQQRLARLLEHPVLAPLLLAPRCSIPMHELMDIGGVLLAGAGGQDGEVARLGSTALLVQALLASQRRATVSGAEPGEGFRSAQPDFHLCLDEAQRLLNGNASLARMLLPRDPMEPDADVVVELSAQRVGVVVVNQSQDQLDGPVLQALRRLPCQILLGATQEDAWRYAQEHQSLGLAPVDFRDQERHLHQRVRLLGQDLLYSARLLGRPLPEQAPPAAPIAEDWRSVRAPARTAEGQRLDELIRQVQVRAAHDPDEALQRLGQLALTEPAVFARYGERTRAHRLAQRMFLLRHPGALPDQAERLRTLSALWVGVPLLEVRAFQRALEEQAEGRGGGRGA